MSHSPLAVIHPEAKIGENVTIDPFAVIEKDVVIGDNCHIFSHAVILDGARIGNNCKAMHEAPSSCRKNEGVESISTQMLRMKVKATHFNHCWLMSTHSIWAKTGEKVVERNFIIL